MPGGHPGHLPLSIPTTIDERAVRLDLGVASEPLLAEHGNKCSEEGDGQTCVKDALNFDNGGIGTSPYGPVRRNIEVGCFLKRGIGDEHKDGVA